MAARFWVGGGSAATWAATVPTNWSLTSGGANNQSVPVLGDTVTFDGAGGTGNTACTIGANAACTTFTITTGYTNTITFTANLAVSGSITLGNAAYTLAGAGLLRMIAAGTWTTNGKSVAVPVEIGGTTTFTCTFADALTVTGALTLTNTTSTIFSGNFLLSAASCTVSGSQTITMAMNVQITNLTTFSDANVVNGAFEWRTGGLTTTGSVTGTATMVFNGTGTWTGAAGTLSMSTTVNTAGTLTLSGTILYAASGTPTLTYTAGTITVGSSIVSIAAACTMVGMQFFSLTITAAITLTINTTTITGTGTLTLPNAAVTFAGTAGWTFATVTSAAYSATRITSFKEAITYTITGNLTSDSTDLAAEKHTWTSSHASTKAIITLAFGASQDLAYFDATRIDSSAGQTIFSFRGASPNDCLNWTNFIAAGIITPGIEGAVSILGTTKDVSGNAIPAAAVYLFRYDATSDNVTYRGNSASDGSGLYGFTVYAGATYFVVAFKNGSPNVFDVTDRTLTGV